MTRRTFKTEQEVLDLAKKAMGKKLKDLDVNNRFANSQNKGRIGHIIEEGIFGFKLDSSQEADIANLGIEIKSTGFKRKGPNQITAKERLVLSMIDFKEDYKHSFYDSHVFKKMDKILFILYEYDKNKGMEEATIENVFLFKYDDLPIKKRNIFEKRL